MKEKAAAKNPDEFYFGMTHTKMEGGVHQKRKVAGPGVDDMKAFKKDDHNYVAMKYTMETRVSATAASHPRTASAGGAPSLPAACRRAPNLPVERNLALQKLRRL